MRLERTGSRGVQPVPSPPPRMRIVRATLHPYRLPLVGPLRLAFGTLTAREGVLLRLEDDAGRVGWGEAAPLPGFSPDTLEAATRVLRAFADDPNAYDRDDAGLHAAPHSPAARAAIDGARLDLDAQRARLTMARVLAPSAAATVYVNALLTGDPPAVLARADAARADGYRAAKLKVGQRSPDEDAALVRAVSACLGPAVALRLDANRAWSYADAVRFARGVAGVPLAYVEEPLAGPARLAEFARETGLPVALDESLAALAPSDLAAHGYAAAVVLKPLVLGGVRRCLRWAEAARTDGLVPVVSAAFESGVGLRHALALAAALGETPAGLDTYRYLAADVLAPRLPLGGPSVDVADALALREVLAGPALA